MSLIHQNKHYEFSFSKWENKMKLNFTLLGKSQITANFRKIFKNFKIFVWVFKGSACCNKAASECPEVKIDGQLVSSIYLPKGILEILTVKPYFGQSLRIWSLFFTVYFKLIKSSKWRGEMFIRIWWREWWTGFWCCAEVLQI